MSTSDVANKLVQLCRQGKFMEAGEALYSPDIVSVEAAAPPGGSREVKGIDAVRKKGEGFMASHEVHSSTVEGPLVAGSYFAVTFKLDMTFKPEKRRFTMEEVAVYKVVNGKVVREEFFYNTQEAVAAQGEIGNGAEWGVAVWEALSHFSGLRSRHGRIR